MKRGMATITLIALIIGLAVLGFMIYMIILFVNKGKTIPGEDIVNTGTTAAPLFFWAFSSAKRRKL